MLESSTAIVVEITRELTDAIKAMERAPEKEYSYLAGACDVLQRLLKFVYVDTPADTNPVYTSVDCEPVQIF